MQDIKLSTKELKQYLENINNVKVLVIGDIGIDKYILGRVKRISPEAPVPILEVQESYDRIGLSGNVALNAKALGAYVKVISVLGHDENAKKLEYLLDEAEVDAYFVKEHDRKTTVKTRVIADGLHHIARIDEETKIIANIYVQAQVLENLEKEITNYDILILEDYAKGFLGDKNFIQAIIKLAKDNNVPVFVDPNRNTPFDFYYGASLFKPNRDELRALSNIENIEGGAKFLQKHLDLDYLLVTLGKKGMDLYFNHHKKHIDSFALEVYDVSGAGDTVIATLASCFASGLDIEKSIYISNIAAATVVAKVGTAVLKKQEILHLIEEKIIEFNMDL